MQFRPFEQGIEVYGPSIDAIIEGFALFPTIALEKLVQRGIGTLKPSTGNAKAEILIDRSKWYPQAAWLAAFEDIAQAVGSQVMFKIGNQVPRHAPFPPSVTDIVSALRSIDVAYHMNHRKNGRVMFDPERNTMMEGIGHYAYVETNTPRQVHMDCNNPYPCDLDRGILQAVAGKMQAGAQVTHDKTGPCRKKGQNNCIFIVSW